MVGFFHQISCVIRPEYLGEDFNHKVGKSGVIVFQYDCITRRFGAIAAPLARATTISTGIHTSKISKQEAYAEARHINSNHP